MRTLVIGIDGYMGWPLALRLAMAGFDVLGIDDLSRRRFSKQLRCSSVTPVPSLQERLEASSCGFRLWLMDALGEGILTGILKKHQPDVVFYLAKPLYAGAPGCCVRSIDVVGLSLVRQAIDDAGVAVRLIHCLDLSGGSRPGETQVCVGAVFGLNHADMGRDPRLCTRFDWDPCSGLPLHRLLVAGLVGADCQVMDDLRGLVPLDLVVGGLAWLAESGQTPQRVRIGGDHHQGLLDLIRGHADRWGLLVDGLSVIAAPEEVSTPRGAPDIAEFGYRHRFDLQTEMRELLGWLVKCRNRAKAMPVQQEGSVEERI